MKTRSRICGTPCSVCVTRAVAKKSWENSRASERLLNHLRPNLGPEMSGIVAPVILTVREFAVGEVDDGDYSPELRQ